MTLEQLKYSKCPSCKKHGITAFFKSGRYTHKLTCKHCSKKFKINSALNVFAHIGIGIFVGLIAVFVNEYIVPTPVWFWIPAIIILLLCFQYFAPLEELEKSASRSKEQDEAEQQRRASNPALVEYERDLSHALLKHYDRAEVIKYFDIKNGEEHIDMLCLINADDRLDLASIVTYDGGETLDLIPLIKNIQIPNDYSVKSIVSNYMITFFISDDSINGCDYKDIVEYSYNNLNYWIGIKSISS